MLDRHAVLTCAPRTVFVSSAHNTCTQVEMLEYLAKVAKGPTQKLEVRRCCAALMSASFQFVVLQQSAGYQPQAG